MNARALIGALIAFGATFAISGCGLASQPETDGLRLDDGVAPFVDRGALQFCVGTERLVAEVARQGSCRADAQIPAACETNEDCASPEACVCGLCRVQFCETSADCREGLTCAGSPRRCIARCVEDADCGDYGVCAGGACETACWTQDDCPTGELCLVGRCAAIGCGVDGPRCFEGETCELQATEGAVLAGDAVAARDVAGTSEGAQVVLFAELRTPSAPSRLMRFESVDGAQFIADAGAGVAPPAGFTRIGSPSVLVTEAGLVIAVELDGGAAVAIARDTSGAGTGPLDLQVVLTPGDWVSAIHAPALAEVQGALLLAFAGAGDEGIGLCVETGGAFALPAAPTLTAADYERFGRLESVSDLGGPELIVAQSAAGRTILGLFAHARGITQPVGEVDGPLDVPTFSVVYAAGVLEAGEDGEDASAIAFTVATDNPTFGRVQNFAPLEESDPSVVTVDGLTRLYYTGSDGLRVAENPVR